MYDPKKAHYVSHTLIIVKEGKFLIVRRSPEEKSFAGMWTVPGGRLESSDYERKPDTVVGEFWYNVGELVCKREVLEEIGWNVPIEKMSYATSLTLKLPNGIPVFVNSYYMIASDADMQEIKLEKDLVEHAWVTLKEAKAYNLIPGIWDELAMVDRIVKGQKTKLARQKA